MIGTCSPWLGSKTFAALMPDWVDINAPTICMLRKMIWADRPIMIPIIVSRMIFNEKMIGDFGAGGRNSIKFINIRLKKKAITKFALVRTYFSLNPGANINTPAILLNIKKS